MIAHTDSRSFGILLCTVLGIELNDPEIEVRREILSIIFIGGNRHRKATSSLAVPDENRVIDLNNSSEASF